jgi:opacity protein-like surface antigen
LTGDYWSKSEGSGDFEVDFRDIAFGARGQYVFSNDNPRVSPYAAAGIAIHLFKVDVPEQEIAGFTVGGSDSDSKIGVDLAGGIEYASSEKMKIIGEVMYRIVSDIEQFVISAALMFPFGS